MAEKRVRIETPVLVRGLSAVKGALGKREGIQALTYVLFQVGDNKVTLTAYNQSISARVILPTHGDYKEAPFAFAMDGRFGLSMASSAKGEVFELVFNDDDLAKVGNNASFYGRAACGDAEWTPLCIPESSYPLVNVKRVSTWTVARALLHDVLSRVMPAVQDISRTVEGGPGQESNTVNSFGLHFRDGFVEAGGGGRYIIAKLLTEAKFNFVLAHDGVQALRDMIGLSVVETVQFGLTEDNEVVFTFGADSLGIFTAQNYWLDIVAKLEAPVEQTKRELFMVDKVMFTGAIEQVQFLSEGEHGVRLTKSGNALLVYADDEVGQKGKVVLRVNWKIADEYDISFNWQFLKDLANTFGSTEQERMITVREGKTGNGRPVMYVENPGIKAYVIPLRGMVGKAAQKAAVAVAN